MYDTLIKLETTDGVLIATVGNEIDLANAPILQRYLMEASHDAQAMVVSLTECRYIDSSGLRALIHVARRLPGRFAVVAARNTHVRRVFDITRFQQRLRVCSSLPEALFALRSLVPA